MELNIQPNPLNGGESCVFECCGNYYYADRAFVRDAWCIETMIFAANSDGKVTDWGDLYCDRSGKSLRECIEEFCSDDYQQYLQEDLD